jgi:hypothetical protein
MNRELETILFSSYINDLRDDDLTRLKYVVEDKVVIHDNLAHNSLHMQGEVHLEGFPCKLNN